MDHLGQRPQGLPIQSCVEGLHLDGRHTGVLGVAAIERPEEAQWAAYGRAAYLAARRAAAGDDGDDEPELVAEPEPAAADTDREAELAPIVHPAGEDAPPIPHIADLPQIAQLEPDRVEPEVEPPPPAEEPERKFGLRESDLVDARRRRHRHTPDDESPGLPAGGQHSPMWCATADETEDDT